MLSSWGVKFEGFDVEAEPERRRDLEPFGVPRVPAPIVGDRVIPGWNPKALAELVGATYAERRQLAPAELARRLTPCWPRPSARSARSRASTSA